MVSRINGRLKLDINSIPHVSANFAQLNSLRGQIECLCWPGGFPTPVVGKQSDKNSLKEIERKLWNQVYLNCNSSKQLHRILRSTHWWNRVTTTVSLYYALRCNTMQHWIEQHITQCLRSSIGVWLMFTSLRMNTKFSNQTMLKHTKLKMWILYRKTTTASRQFHCQSTGL